MSKERKKTDEATAIIKSLIQTFPALSGIPSTVKATQESMLTDNTLNPFTLEKDLLLDNFLC